MLPLMMLKLIQLLATGAAAVKNTFTCCISARGLMKCCKTASRAIDSSLASVTLTLKRATHCEKNSGELAKFVATKYY